MKTYYDDNYGTYRIESDDDLRFFHETQAVSVVKVCEGCGRKVKIRPEYGYCNSCAERREQGEDL